MYVPSFHVFKDSLCSSCVTLRFEWTSLAVCKKKSIFCIELSEWLNLFGGFRHLSSYWFIMKKMKSIIPTSLRRVWLQTALVLSALAFSALARSDTSASASDATCSLLNVLFCSIYWLFFVWISQQFTTVAGGEDKKKITKIQCHLQSLLALSATCDVTCIRHESCALPTETRRWAG